MYGVTINIDDEIPLNIALSYMDTACLVTDTSGYKIMTSFVYITGNKLTVMFTSIGF